MAKVPKKIRTWNPSEILPSLLCFILFSSLTSVSSAADWYVNDTKTEGDRFTTAIGNDRSGDGSAAKPFLSLRKALQSVKDGDHLYLDTGDYAVPSFGTEVLDLESLPITLSGITIEGAGPEKTRLNASGQAGLVLKENRNVRLTGFSILGGEVSLTLDQCKGSTLNQIWTQDSQTYGILLKDSEENKLDSCRTKDCDFRGLQLRHSDNNKLSNHLSSGNGNAGISLDESSENRLEKCLTQNNGMSGYYILRKSEGNRIENCVAEKNKFVGFYLDIGSTSNKLLGNESLQNTRGFTLNGSSENILQKNRASSNQVYGFWIKNNSLHNSFEQNKADANGDAGFVFAPDSFPSNFQKNQSLSNEAADSPTSPQTVSTN